jgi:hypothetical protein
MVKKKMKRGVRKLSEYSKIRRRNFPKVKVILSALIILLLGFVVWANIFFYKNCDTPACFNDYLKDCNRAKFISGGDMIFEYKIEGSSGNICKVTTTLLQGDLNNQDSLKLENREMVCEIPLGRVIVPQSNLDDCHGDLKEGFQELFISKLHRYIVQNIGDINADILGVI